MRSRCRSSKPFSETGWQASAPASRWSGEERHGAPDYVFSTRRRSSVRITSRSRDALNALAIDASVAAYAMVGGAAVLQQRVKPWRTARVTNLVLGGMRKFDPMAAGPMPCLT